MVNIMKTMQSHKNIKSTIQYHLTRLMLGVKTPKQYKRFHDKIKQQLPTIIQGKKILITGASSGIGHETALLLGKAGAHVLVVARRQNELEELCNELKASGHQACFYPADLSDPDTCKDLVRQIINDHGYVDILINNAGRSIHRTVFQSLDRFHDYQRTMDINYFGTLRLTLGLLPCMLERNQGHILNITSAAVKAITPGFPAYLASKSAFETIAHSLRLETFGTGITCTSVFMPLVRTPMSAPSKAFHSMPSLSPSNAADMIADALIRKPPQMLSFGFTILEICNALIPGYMAKRSGSEYNRIIKKNEP